MVVSMMIIDQLKNKAHSLPQAPGVYLMKNKLGEVIYVGKAKKLRNRVSQYFVQTVSHSPKTVKMVSQIHDFDVIVAATEFEALVLECSLIKQHMPKYNILLKDGKGYPYLRLDMTEPFPRISMVGKCGNDDAEYYGPYGSRGITQDLLETINRIFQLSNCSKKFPQDLGKGRPCLHFHMGQCAGWCQQLSCENDYRLRIKQARELLCGSYSKVADEVKRQMLDAADNLHFELAANLRNRYNAIQALGQKQMVTAGAATDTDVVGYGQTEAKACFTVLHFLGGNLIDKEYEVFPVPEDSAYAVSSLVKQYYLAKGFAPKRILLPFAMEDTALIGQYFTEQFGKKINFIVPQRGDNLQLIQLANKNAEEEANRVTSKEERAKGAVQLLGKILKISTPQRIESFDISHISGSDIVGSMVVFIDGKPRKSDYKRFKLADMEEQDDYGAMRQVLTRRFKRYLEADAGFDTAPNLLLIDGGEAHASIAEQVLANLNLSYPVFGMVKDDRHRTRALVTASGDEIRIDANQSIFSFVGAIQEETHRFAITYHRNLRSKRLRYSQLDAIDGIGPKRKQELLKHFSSIKAISLASLPELERLLPKPAAQAVYHHFHNKE